MGTGPFLCKKEDSDYSWIEHRKKGTAPFFLLFLLRKKDAYKHVDLVQDLP